MQNPKPTKLTIIDIDDPGTTEDGPTNMIEVQFNPTAFKRAIESVYQEHEILGGSFEPQEYVRTSNQVINLTLQYEASIRRELEQLEKAQKFIESFLYPPEADSFVTNAPNRMLLLWPNTMSIRARLHKATFTHNRFNRFGHTVGMSIDMTIKEAAVRRITRGLVQKHGAIRPNSGVSPQS